MYVSLIIGGWGAETNREIVSFRSSVLAQLYIGQNGSQKSYRSPFPFPFWPWRDFFRFPLGDQVFPFP